MRTRRPVGAKRLLAVCAGLMFVGAVGAGPAWAADTTTGDTSTSGASSSSTTGDSSSTTGGSSVPSTPSVPVVPSAPSVVAPSAPSSLTPLVSTEDTATPMAETDPCVALVQAASNAQAIFNALQSAGLPTADAVTALNDANQAALDGGCTLASTTGSSSTTGTTGGASQACASLASQLATAQAAFATALNAIDSLPDGVDVPDALQEAADTAQAQIKTIQDQITALGCSSLTTSGSTTSTTATSTTSTTDTSTGVSDICTDTEASYYNCYGTSTGYTASTPVAATVPTTGTATQVSSVPTGGVDTGDGSY